MRSRVASLILPLFALAMGSLGFYHVVSSAKAKSSLQPPSPPMTKPFEDAIAARGLIEPRQKQVMVSAAVSGLVIRAAMTEEHVGQEVHQGQELLKIDDRQLQAQLVLAKAKALEADAQLSKLRQMPRTEEIPPSEARVKQAEARLVAAKDRYERVIRLLPGAASTEQELVESESDAKGAEQSLTEAKAAHALLLAGAWKPDIDTAEAACKAAQAEVARIETEIERTVVRAPLDGRILQVNKRVGEYVHLQGNEFLFVLGDMSQLRVRAEIDEEDVPRFLPGAQAKAFRRGKLAQGFDLKFLRVEPLVEVKKTWTGDNTERSDTRVLPVLFEVQNAPNDLYVGQIMEVLIDGNRESAGLGQTR